MSPIISIIIVPTFICEDKLYLSVIIENCNIVDKQISNWKK